MFELNYAIHVLQLQPKTFSRVWCAESDHFPRLVCGKWLLLWVWCGERGHFPSTIRRNWSLNIVKIGENVPVLSQFCCIARSLVNHFPRTIPLKVLTVRGMIQGKCWLSVYHTPGSEHFPGYGMKKVSTFRDMVCGKWIKFYIYLCEIAAKI